MKYARTRNLTILAIACLAAALLFAAVTGLSQRFAWMSRYGLYIAIVETVIALILGALLLLRLFWERRATLRIVAALADQIDPFDSKLIKKFPFPVAVTDENGTIEWYNERFLNAMLDGDTATTLEIASFLTGADPADLKKDGASVTYKDRAYTVFSSSMRKDGVRHRIYYYIDDTGLKRTREDYFRSRPVVLLLAVEGAEESGKEYKSSDLAEIRTDIERILEDWSAQYDCLVRRIRTDRYLMVTEAQYLSEMKMLRNRYLSDTGE